MKHTISYLCISKIILPFVFCCNHLSTVMVVLGTITILLSSLISGRWSPSFKFYETSRFQREVRPTRYVDIRPVYRGGRIVAVYDKLEVSSSLLTCLYTQSLDNGSAVYVTMLVDGVHRQCLAQNEAYGNVRGRMPNPFILRTQPGNNSNIQPTYLKTHSRTRANIENIVVTINNAFPIAGFVDLGNPSYNKLN